jgi:uncharacterized protein (DUF2062 family)
MFRRRQKPSLSQRVREFFWPSMGFRRSTRYLAHRVARMPGTPSSIALGFACGVAVIFTPFVGLHLVIALVVAWILRGSPLAAAVGTLASNPWTIPPILIGTYKLGARMLGEHSRHHLPHDVSFFYMLHHPMQLLLPMGLGAIPLGLAAGLITYFPARYLVKKYQHRRHLRRRLPRRPFDNDNAVAAPRVRVRDRRSEDEARTP